MDQGIAALAGAAIGIIGTLGAAHLTGRAQRAQWRRQVRRDAYSVFISRYDAAVRAGQEAVFAIREDRFEDSINQAFLGKVREARGALTPVQLEGPEALAWRAESATRQLDTWSYIVDRLINGDGTLTADMAIESADRDEERCTEELAKIIELGRKLLNQ
ncbi:proline dehydrogenase [Streptomyces gardneri]|uniref:proline dehydrogenase n=1 Tax=Streptomyces gardneri TaxID=66892 RepID=UPI0035DB1679